MLEMDRLARTPLLMGTDLTGRVDGVCFVVLLVLANGRSLSKKSFQAVDVCSGKV
jgi:hypothetical protein